MCPFTRYNISLNLFQDNSIILSLALPKLLHTTHDDNEHIVSFLTHVWFERFWSLHRMAALAREVEPRAPP